MIDDKRMQEAIDFLSETDEEAARLRTDAEREEFRARAVKDAIFLRMEGTIAERQALAATSQEYLDAQSGYFAALELAEKTRNRRTTAELIVRAWQTVSSNRRQGNV